MNYILILNHYWETAPFQEGFKPSHSALFTALLHLFHEVATHQPEPVAVGVRLVLRVDRGDRYQLPVIHANDGEETRDFMPCVSREARIALYALPANFFVYYDRDGTPETPNLWLAAIAETYGQLRHELLDFPSHIASIGARGAARIERA